MGSNVDALIAAGIHPPQVEDQQTAALKAMQMRDMQQQAQYRGQLAQIAGLQMQKEQRALNDDQITRQAYMDAAGDLNQTQQLIRQRGGSPEAAQKIALQQLAIRKELGGINKEELENTGKRHDQLRGAVLAFEQQPDDVKAQQWPTFVQQQLKNGNLTQDEYNNALQLHPTYPGADQMQLYANGLRTGTQAIEEELKSQQIAEARTKATEARRGAALQALSGLELDQNGQPKDMDAYNALAAQYKGILPQAPGPGVLPRLIGSGVGLKDQPKYQIEQSEAQATKDLLENPQRVQALVAGAVDPKKYPDEFNRTWNRAMFALQTGGVQAMRQEIGKGGDNVAGLERGIAQAKATVPFKIDVAAGSAAAKEAATAAAGGMTPDDISREGQLYAVTGQINAGRDSVLRQKIIHAGNEWARNSGLSPREMLAARAAYQGDVGSLKNFQKQRDQIVSFEQTAQKNLDLFLNQAQKIIDTGSPWINKPLRSLDEKVLGSDDIAAVNVARQVANNEIAKVTSGGGMSGVLSDAARNEVASYNPGSATFKQTVRIANILRQDMANRHQSMDDTLQNIKERIGGQAATTGAAGGGAQTAAPPLPSQLSQNDVGKTYTNRAGQRIKITAVNPQNPQQYKKEIVQ